MWTVKPLKKPKIETHTSNLRLLRPLYSRLLRALGAPHRWTVRLARMLAVQVVEPAGFVHIYRYMYIHQHP